MRINILRFLEKPEQRSCKVLVHPHFSIRTREVIKGNQKTPKAGKNLSPRGLEIVSANQALHDFYKKEVDETKEKQDEHLVIVESTPCRTQDLLSAIRWGDPDMSEKEAREILWHYQGLQKKLVNYAKKQLGRRFRTTRAEPKNVGAWLRNEARNTDIQVSVMGEHLPWCVDAAHKGLLSAGFNASIIKEKTF